jgi:hypothetical protein
MEFLFELIVVYILSYPGVKKDFHWIYSSALNYQEIESVIEVERIVHRLITCN